MSPKGLKKLLLVGNPNVGKSVIFGNFTGKYATVSNYPGTTVEVSTGNAVIKGVQYVIMDTPGINSLLPMSEDEQVTRDILLMEDFDTVVQVADVKNLRRSLIISLQLAEMGVPFVMALNMADEAENLGISTDLSVLSQKTGVDTISTVATRKKGISKLKDAVSSPKHSTLSVVFGDRVESAIKEMEPLLPEARISRRSLALMLLGGDSSLRNWLHSLIPDDSIDALEEIVNSVQAQYPEPLGYYINRKRLAVVDKIVKSCQSRVKEGGEGLQAVAGGHHDASGLGPAGPARSALRHVRIRRGFRSRDAGGLHGESGIQQVDKPGHHPSVRLRAGAVFKGAFHRPVRDCHDGGHILHSDSPAHYGDLFHGVRNT